MAIDPESPQVLVELPSEMEAALVVGYLDEGGIQAVLSGSGRSNGWPEGRAWYQVVVRHADWQQAKELLAKVPPHAG